MDHVNNSLYPRPARQAERKSSPSQPPAPGLRAYIIDGQELVFVMPCAECGEPIVDLDDANIMVAGAPDDLGQPMTVGDIVVQEIGGLVIAKHKAHDAGGERPWVPANQVLRSDQRGLRDRAARYMNDREAEG